MYSTSGTSWTATIVMDVVIKLGFGYNSTMILHQGSKNLKKLGSKNLLQTAGSFMWIACSFENCKL
jgi:hypothetical protein